MTLTLFVHTDAQERHRDERVYRQDDQGWSFGGGAAALPMGPRTLSWRAPSSSPAFELAPDLGRDIGSRMWWRGLTTCLALLAATWLLAPDFTPLPGYQGVTAPYSDTQPLAIAPLAFGGDSGVRTAPTDAVQLLTDVPERPTIDIATTLGQGDGIARALERSGVGAGDAAQIVAMTREVADPATIAPGTPLALTLGRRTSRFVPRPVEHLTFRARFDTRLTFARGPGGLTMQRETVKVDATPLRVTGQAGGGIFLAATAAGAPAQAVQSYIRAIASKVALGSLDPSARYDMIVERQRAATGEVRFGKLLFAGLTEGGRSTRMIQWTIDGRTDWYDAAGVGAQRSGLTSPVAGHVTSGFGLRFHPLLGYTRMHQGVDYGAVYGSPIRAVTDGIVSFAGWHGGHGNMVKLAHGGGLGTGYAHMSRIAVAPGEHVAQGQVIGYVGSTGLSTGPHLHFEVYRGGSAIDPAGATFAAQPLLTGPELAAFHARLTELTGTARSSLP